MAIAYFIIGLFVAKWYTWGIEDTIEYKQIAEEDRFISLLITILVIVLLWPAAIILNIFTGVDNVD